MFRIVLNGKEIEAPEDATVLEVARDQGIDIPTLCYHPALGVYGVCRLCVVEVSGSLPRSLRISCAQDVQEGLVVETETELVQRNRRLILELLLGRCPDSQELNDMAAAYGVTGSRFYQWNSEDKCVRCGRCIRACRDKIGVYALCFAHRGYGRKVATEFEDLSEYCIGCGSCAQVCPTGAILMKDEGDQRTIYTRDQVVAQHKLEKCAGCGIPYAPRKYLDYVSRNADQTTEVDIERNLCPSCARNLRAEDLVGQISVL